MIGKKIKKKKEKKKKLRWRLAREMVKMRLYIWERIKKKKVDNRFS